MNEPLAVMRPRDLGDVVLKAAGLYMLWCGLISLPALFFTASGAEEQGPGAAFVSAAYGALFFALGFVLLRWSSQLSGRLFARQEGMVLALPAAAELQVVAFRVMGVYILATSLPALVQWVVPAVTASSSEDLIPWIAGTAVQVVMGIALMGYRRGWPAQIWNNLRPLSERDNEGDPPG